MVSSGGGVTLDDAVSSGRPTLEQCGLIVGAAGAVVQALTIATTCAHAEWATSEVRSATLGKAVILGQVAGAVVWCGTADVVGRKEASCLACVVVAAATAACGFAATFELLRVSCCVAGFGLAGVALVPTVLVVESAPTRRRGRYVALLGWFATAGSALAALIHVALAAVWDAPWRSVCVLCALLPFGSGVIATNRLRESVRWLACKGRFAAARRIVESDAHALEALAAFERAQAVGADKHVSWTETVANAIAAVHGACRAASVCAWGLAFLVAFGGSSVVSLIRLEFDANDDVRAAAFQRRLQNSAACPSLDYTVVVAALVSEFGGVGLALHMVDRIGRRPALAGLCAAGAAGVLALAAPEYFPDSLGLGPGRRTLLAAMMASRGALSAAALVVALLVAEMRATPHRAAAAAIAFALSKFGALLADNWVVSPNPVATIALLVTLVNVSAAWAALALPVETANRPIDALVLDRKRHLLLIGIADFDDLALHDFSTRATPVRDGPAADAAVHAPCRADAAVKSSSENTPLLASA